MSGKDAFEADDLINAAHPGPMLLYMLFFLR